jgi:hypothetical protein
MAKSKISPSANPGLEGRGTRAYSPVTKNLPGRQPVPVGRSHALLLDADHIRVLPVGVLCLLLELRHGVFRCRAPFAFNVQPHDHQIGAPIVAARDPAQEELRRRIVHSNLGRLALELDRASQLEGKAGVIRGASGGLNRTSSRTPFQVSSAQTCP